MNWSIRPWAALAIVLMLFARASAQIGGAAPAPVDPTAKPEAAPAEKPAAKPAEKMAAEPEPVDPTAKPESAAPTDPTAKPEKPTPESGTEPAPPDPTAGKNGPKTSAGPGKAPPPAVAVPEIPPGLPKLPLPDPSKESRGPFRKVAPGILHTVRGEAMVGETFNWQDMIELSAQDDKFTWAKDVPFRRDIWALTIRFKPVRAIYVDIPEAGGKMSRKPIWYMIYSVTNPGQTLRPQKQEDGTYSVVAEKTPIAFVPDFVLVSDELQKAYKDRLVPLAMGPITQREDPNRRFLNNAEMTREIQAGETFVGVTTWEDVDPRIDHFVVYIRGLTNAYRWTDEPGQFKAGDKPMTGKKIERKVLRLAFWHPSDEFETEDWESHYGIPGHQRFKWLFMPDYTLKKPGPGILPGEVDYTPSPR